GNVEIVPQRRRPIMFRKVFSFGGTLLLTGVAILVTPGISLAQRGGHGGGGHGGGGHGGGGHFGGGRIGGAGCGGARFGGFGGGHVGGFRSFDHGFRHDFGRG